VRSLGLSYVDQTGTDSQARTILGSEEGHAKSEVMPSNPERAQFFGKVKRMQTQTEEMAEAEQNEGEGAGTGAPTNRSQGLSAAAAGRGQKSPGLKKNVWEVRKK